MNQWAEALVEWYHHKHWSTQRITCPILPKIPHGLASHWLWASEVTDRDYLPEPWHCLLNVNHNMSVFSEYYLWPHTLPSLQLCVTVSQSRHPPCMNRICTHSILHYLREMPSCCYVWQVYDRWLAFTNSCTDNGRNIKALLQPHNLKTQTVPLQTANISNTMKHQK